MLPESPQTPQNDACTGLCNLVLVDSQQSTTEAAHTHEGCLAGQLTNSAYGQRRDKHAGGGPHAIGPHHEQEAEGKKGKQAAEVKLEGGAVLWQGLPQVDDQSQSLA